MLNGWTSPVTNWLRTGGFSSFEANNFTRLVLLGAMVRDLSPPDGQTSSLLDSFDDLLLLGEQLRGDSFAARRSPFLMTWVNRVLSQVSSRDGDSIHASLSACMLHFFDSFYEDLPSGSKLELDQRQLGSTAHLISRGVKIDLSANGPIEIKKISSSRMSVQSSSGSFEVVFPLEAGLLSVSPINKVPVATGFNLLADCGPTLYEKEYLFKVYSDIPMPERLAGLIADSLEIIFSVWPDLRESFGKTIRYFVPIHQTEARTHNSFSAQSTVGVIFLSESYDDLKLVEAIVHEFHHNELYMYMQVNELLGANSGSKLYYSPWRNDARPLFGLLHACYVFTAVANYMRAAERVSKDTRLAEYYFRGRRQVVERLVWGLAQIGEDDVTNLGHELVVWMSRELQGHCRDFGVEKLLEPSADQSRHLSAWQSTHPDLAGSVRSPAFAQV
jgi:HEXXH motif-containing protein